MGKKVFKILFLAIGILALLFVGARLAGYRALRYPSEAGNSMSPTVSPGDVWLCRMKRGFSSGDLKPGMVILFPKEGFRSLLTKRIIALENQAVEVRERAVFVDGQEIMEPYAFFSGEKPTGFNAPHDASRVETTVVPPGQLFVMGDNRDNSFDSRDPRFGLVDVKDIVGRPLLILWAKEKSRIGRGTK
jgi:signal peptidase I